MTDVMPEETPIEEEVVTEEAVEVATPEDTETAPEATETVSDAVEEEVA